MNKSKQEMHVNADLTHNVHVIVGKPLPNGKLQVSTDRTFKNTATRLMTASIAKFLAGSEHSYNRKAGRPNFMSFGTMGIKLQPNNIDITDANRSSFLEDNFTDIIVEPEERTRPWFESTSLALTDTCGPAVLDEDGYNPHFWDYRYGWSERTDGELTNKAVFQGELCTEYGNVYNVDQVKRSAILRADVASDCPQDLEYGKDGYASTVIFYGYAPVQWVNYLLAPPNGAQLQRMAISEFGLYEKSNLDPNGMCTMFAGFRVPSIKDIVYVSKDEVILVEWRVTVRALMPNEKVAATDNEGHMVTGISINAAVQETPPGDTRSFVQFSATVLGEGEVDQRVRWDLAESAEPYKEGTRIGPATGLLTVAANEQDVVYITATSIIDENVTAKAAVLTGIKTNYVTGITVNSHVVDAYNIDFDATVRGKGLDFDQRVSWVPSSDDEHELDPDTKITVGAYGTAKLTISPTEQCRNIKVTVTSQSDVEIFAASVVVRIGSTEGSYKISDFTILTN